MKNLIRTAFLRFVASSFFVGLMATPVWSTPVLSLVPTTDISGPRGGRVGWGFSITNDADYIEITGAAFCLNPVSFPACTAPAQGIFTDFISQFNDIVVGHAGSTLPDTVSQLFDALVFTGIGSFDIDLAAPIFSADIGYIVLTYNVFDADPNGLDPVTQLFSDQTLFASTTVSVTDEPPVLPEVPEPSSFLLASVGALAVLAARKRR